jgi:predicted GNAT superfamily acetyltransferase
MLGVREDLRSGFDIGWLIKIVQGYIALQTNHSEMIWTFDPMRGANARLNIEKLAAGVDDLTLDKYGVLRSTLYGEVPSDRFTARWNLRSPVVHERIQAVHAGRYTPATFQDMADAVELFGRDDDPAPGDRVRYEIPGDIDALMERDPTSAIRWRQQMRRVLTSLVSTKNRVVGDYERDGPAAIGYEKQYGTHQISAFATELAEGGERRSAYLLTRIKKGE